MKWKVSRETWHWESHTYSWHIVSISGHKMNWMFGIVNIREEKIKAKQHLYPQFAHIAMQEEMGCETFDLENGARNQQTFTNLHFPITKIVRYLCCFPLSFKISKCHLRQSWSSLNNAPHKAQGTWGLVCLSMPTHISRCSNAYNSKAKQIVEMHPKEKKKSEMLNGEEEKKTLTKLNAYECHRQTILYTNNKSCPIKPISSEETFHFCTMIYRRYTFQCLRSLRRDTLLLPFRKISSSLDEQQKQRGMCA